MPEPALDLEGLAKMLTPLPAEQAAANQRTVEALLGAVDDGDLPDWAAKGIEEDPDSVPVWQDMFLRLNRRDPDRATRTAWSILDRLEPDLAVNLLGGPLPEKPPLGVLRNELELPEPRPTPTPTGAQREDEAPGQPTPTSPSPDIPEDQKPEPEETPDEPQEPEKEEKEDPECEKIVAALRTLWEEYEDLVDDRHEIASNIAALKALIDESHETPDSEFYEDGDLEEFKRKDSLARIGYEIVDRWIGVPGKTWEVISKTERSVQPTEWIGLDGAIARTLGAAKKRLYIKAWRAQIPVLEKELAKTEHFMEQKQLSARQYEARLQACRARRGEGG